MFPSPLLVGLAAGLASVLPATAQSTCNGQSAYCDRSYSNVTQVGAHDSPFVGPLLQQNQNINLTQQLDLGIRFLQGQTHKSLDGDTILLCHTSCLLEDAGSLEAYLATVKTWLDSNPDEVVTLLLTNDDSFPVAKFGDVFASAGLEEYAFVPSSSPNTLAIDKWPTLRNLINNGTRLVAFLDYGADASTVPYILDEFAYFFETAYDVTDSSLSNCSIDRPAGASATGRMYIVNHFLDVDILGILIPDRLRAPETNAVSGDGSIGSQASLCDSMYDRLPNFILLDFVDQGQPIDAQSELNGV
ncbi:PLC-like phosphodiesterase [Aspergillus ellipticus CBS 707.79]|uniref:PLC-like phosphodiesterase n=1 Tax=Aspergillus ellipticus CBS 707.79 TaxID=1448320 RepID=A0A319CZ38_9EURO|nr:PLC-like phosphodiesterase [Aspergillus ellipticus CBS 707.79]